MAVGACALATGLIGLENEFGSDFDTYPANALDPRVNIWDMGGDPLLFANDRADYVHKLLTSEGFEARILGSNGPYSTLRVFRKTNVAA